MSIIVNALFYRPVILYTAGQTSFAGMMFGMFWRLVILGLLIAAAMAMVANDEGVFKQDGNRPDPGIADKARRDAMPTPVDPNMTAADYRASLK